MLKLNNCRNLPMLRLVLASTFGLALLSGVLLTIALIYLPEMALAQGFTNRYVAPAPSGNDTGNDCTNSGAPCATIQHAVDMADPGDEILVAIGTYTDTQARPRADVIATGIITQVVYISKSITIRGGFTTSNWTVSNPEANPTTLDAQHQGRVLYITGHISPAIEGLRMTNGNAAGLGGGGLAGQDFGGGVYLITGTLIMTNNQVFSNSAHFRQVGEVGSRGYGGGAFFHTTSKTTLTNNIFHNNYATIGAGIYFYNSPKPMLINNTISNNVANHLGGGTKHCGGVLFLLSHNATLMKNVINGNSAANDGGGGCFNSSDNVVLTENAIISNTRGASFDGFGIGLSFVNSKNANLIRNIISGNKGDEFIQVTF